MTLDGNGTTTGVIVVTKASGDATISAGRNLNLGDGLTANSKGAINREAGLASNTGNLNINSATNDSTGSLTSTNGSKINDVNLGSGNLNIAAQHGNLALSGGSSIVKSAGTGSMTVDVKAGDITLAGTGTQIKASQSNSNDLIQASGNITNNSAGLLQADNVQAGNDLTNNSQITGVATATNGTLTNNATGSISGNAVATNGALINNHTITGNATATKGTLTNNASGSIGGRAEATNGALTNSGTIGAGATAGGNLTNTSSGTITGTTHAGVDLLNQGLITLNGSNAESVTAGNDLTLDGNGTTTGVIVVNKASGDATISAGRNLNLGDSLTANSNGAISKTAGTGKLTVDAMSGDITVSGTNSQIKALQAGSTVNDIHATGTINNSGLLQADTIRAGVDVNNAGSITGKVTADQNLTNYASITGDAAATNGTLTNNATGSIDGNAVATNGALINNHAITGSASAGTTLTNNATGSIGGNAVAGTALTNSGAISGTATSGNSGLGTLANAAGASIGKGAESKNDSNIDNQGSITGPVTAANDLNNTGKINGDVYAHNDVNNGVTTGNVSTSNDLHNSGSINGSVTAGHDVNNGVIVGDVTIPADGKSLNQQNQGPMISGNVTAGRDVNNGTINGNVLVSGKNPSSFVISNAGTITGKVNAVRDINNGTITTIKTMGNDALIDAVAPVTLKASPLYAASNLIPDIQAGRDVNNAGTLKGTVSARGNINIYGGGQAITSSLVAADTIQIDNGTVTNKGIVTAPKSSGLTLVAKNLLLQDNAKIYSTSSLVIGSSKQTTVVDFNGNNSTISAAGNIGQKSAVYYWLKPNSLGAGNTMGSTNGKVWLTSDNIKQLQKSDKWYGLFSATSNGSVFSFDQSQVNVLVNAFQSNQLGNLINADFSLVAKPVDIPTAHPDPCGHGSSLELKNTAGVVLAYEDILPFSVLSGQTNGGETVDTSNNDSELPNKSATSCDKN